MPRVYVSAQQQSYLYLRDAIVSGALEAGTRIKVEAIADALNVSRIPVREALRQLDSEGLVTIQPNRGATVTLLNADDILEIFEMRSVEEGLAARLAAPVVTDEELAELQHLIERMRYVEHDHLLWTDRHDEFHDFLCQLSRRTQLTARLRQLRLALRPYLRRYTIEHAPEIEGHEHERLIDALATRDPDHAERVLRAHVMRNAETIVAAIASDIRSPSPEPAP